jgi:excisionase family DNA binding protein
MPSTKLLYDMNEAAEMCGLGRTKIYELTQTGELESVKIGKARRVPHDALVFFVESLRSGQQRAS